ncbi:MAG: hypothetical protein KGS61_12580, partial [Verrucomicrobia bacterium]|nr:hypothetical protein [Verrucomicrobiota bacterium]
MRRRFFLGAVLWSLATTPCLGATGAKGLFTLDNLVHPETVVEPGISRLAWRPASHELTYLREERSAKQTNTCLWS